MRVDLTSGQIEVEEPSEVIYRTYPGGGGLPSYYVDKKAKKLEVRSLIHAQGLMPRPCPPSLTP